KEGKNQTLPAGRPKSPRNGAPFSRVSGCRTGWKLSVDIHSCHIGFAVPLHHTQEFPSIFFVKANMVGNQIERRYPFGPHIIDNHVQQVSSDSPAAMPFLCKNSAYIRRKVLPVMKVIFDHA